MRIEGSTARLHTHPGGAICIDLFFPYGYLGLYLIDHPTAGIERLGAMRRAANDKHGGLAQGTPARPVRGNDLLEIPSLGGLLCYEPHAVFGKRKIRFVLEGGDGLGFIRWNRRSSPHYPYEHGKSAHFGSRRLLDGRGHVESLILDPHSYRPHDATLAPEASVER